MTQQQQTYQTIQKDESQANDLFEKAAEEGSWQAQFSLGMIAMEQKHPPDVRGASRSFHRVLQMIEAEADPETKVGEKNFEKHGDLNAHALYSMSKY